MSAIHSFPKVGDTVSGRVYRFHDGGTMVSLGGAVAGTIKNTDLTWLNRKACGGETFTIGDVVDAVVLEVSEPSETGYVYVGLGYKQAQRDPWESVESVHPVGSRVSGRVVSEVAFGAIVEYPSGFRGLIPHRELSWTARKPKVSDHVTVGETVDTEILSVDPVKRRIKASLRLARPNPWHGLAQLYPVDDTVVGTVESVKPYGAFISLPNGCQGLLHTSEMISSPEAFEVGKLCRVRVLSIDEVEERLAFAEAALPCKLETTKAFAKPVASSEYERCHGVAVSF